MTERIVTGKNEPAGTGGSCTDLHASVPTIGNIFSRVEFITKLLNSIHDAIVAIDCEGRIILCNSAAERLAGVKAEEVLGHSLTSVIPESGLPHILETGKEELNVQHNLGNLRILTNRFPIRDENQSLVGAVSVFQDITDIEKMAADVTNLRQVQILLEAIIDCTHDAISVCNESGIQIKVNQAYTRLIGLTPGEVLNHPATIDIVEGESMHFKVLKTRKPVRNYTMKLGPYRREVSVNVAPIVVNDDLRGSVAVIHDLSEIRRLTEELEGARRLLRHLKSRYTFGDIVACSDQIKSCIEQAEKAAQTPATVLLRGESGTGKEIFAHAIHHASDRPQGPFIRVNCAAIADSLLESELFGYVDGAFTGAKRGGRRGLFEEADGGTIFLDEIGDIGPNLQTKLLRILQEKEFVRVGDSQPVCVNVRVIAATNANLEELIRKNVFREDLYYRLNVVPIFIPPLRHRKEDIPVLTTHIIRKFNQEYGRCVESVSTEAQASLKLYSWPGNVRELENVLGRAMINMKPSDIVIEQRHLPTLASGFHETAPSMLWQLQDWKYDGRTLDELYMEWEKGILTTMLNDFKGNKTQVAKALKISLRSLYYKLEKHGLI